MFSTDPKISVPLLNSPVRDRLPLSSRSSPPGFGVTLLLAIQRHYQLVKIMTLDMVHIMALLFVGQVVNTLGAVGKRTCSLLICHGANPVRYYVRPLIQC